MELNEKGIFWLPEDDSRKLSGILNFDPMNGINLELTGSFTDSAEFEDQKIILGFIGSSKITLYKCFNYHLAEHFPGIEEQSYKIDTAFMDVHFDDENDIQFKNLHIVYSYLDLWVSATGLAEERGEDPEGNSEFIWRYNFPPDIDILVDNYKLTFTHLLSREITRFKFSVEQNTAIKIEPENSIHYIEYKEICNHIQNFLSLAIGKAVYPLFIKGESEESTREIEDEIVYNDIEIYSTDIVDSPKTIHPNKIFFTLGDIQDSLEETFNRFVDKSEIIMEVYRLYFSIIYHPDIDIKIKFFNLIRALESYHRRMIGGGYCTKEEFETAKNELIRAIPNYLGNDHKDSLKSRIKYGYQFSLRKRLKMILERDSALFGLVYDEGRNFIEEIVVTRNYFTHFDEDDEENALKGTDLYKATQKLKFIIEICFLFELGISRDEIEELVRQDNRYEGIINNP